jgi:hypothetical protein
MYCKNMYYYTSYQHEIITLIKSGINATLFDSPMFSMFSYLDKSGNIISSMKSKSCLKNIQHTYDLRELYNI